MFCCLLIIFIPNMADSNFIKLLLSVKSAKSFGAY